MDDINYIFFLHVSLVYTAITGTYYTLFGNEEIPQLQLYTSQNK